MADELFNYDATPPQIITEPVSPRPKTARNRPRRSYKPSDQTNEEEQENPLESWVRYAMDGGDLSSCDPEYLPDIIIGLRDVRNSLLVDGFVDDSILAEEALAHARKVHRNNLHKNATKNIRDDLNNRLNEAKDALADLEDTTQFQEARMNEIMVREDAILLDRHTKEMNNLIEEWETQKKCRGYNRISAELRFLRDQADRLLRAKKYQESKIVNKKADLLEKAEIEKGHRLMEADFQLAMDNMKEKHRKERQKQERAHENKRKEYLAAKEFDLNIARKRIAKIEQEIENVADPEKVWALHHRHDFEMPPPVQRETIMTGKRSVVVQEFNTIALPPLKTAKTSRRLIRTAERNYRMNRNYIFT
ncbi:hypothetical protein TRFO_36829 [Tritrichomonas foetus]|uniref:Uncharacterized protein n=1 Tax=Tritrichomonas foetus TaxID=1144522 RepID=A0A1J4JHQ2_9EUKA|nr:hypothetical protein TRFO_36829 [Tritrichomonas foetus]|eukprot:OHS97021.1 hypothetical protein TRFO_36829 [Tritrichomonas foetus]